MINLLDLDNFIFIPNKNEHDNGLIYELEKTDSFAENTFVILPYQNPQTDQVSPIFLKIISEKKLNKNDLIFDKSINPPIHLISSISKEAYLDKVVKLKEHIQLGNIYEINYCIQFLSEQINISPLNIFFKLIELTKAPYTALVKLNNDFIISASPELFLKKVGNKLSSKPIKGTIKRGITEHEDDELKNYLHNSIKERTENVMAVDVSRNDLSIIAQRGSVNVNKLYNIESFETVHQMVSTVSCLIKPEISFHEIIDATFPMASMTGAPKLRAMTLIDEFENFERNYYSGAMGIIDSEGNYTLSVIIRSIFYNIKTQKLSIAVGGAITYLSDPEKEYEECLLKANALLKVLDAKIV